MNYGVGWDGAGFAKDALGRVWVKGLVKNGDAGASTVFTLPSGYRPPGLIYHIGVAWADAIARLVIWPSGEVTMNVLAGSNAWASIVCVFTADGEADWHEVGGAGEPAFENSWVNYGGSWDTCAFYKDACGIVHIKGLVKDGTIGWNPVFHLPVGYRPRADLNWSALSNLAIGRLEITPDGGVNPAAGSNASFSVHCSFPAEQ